MIGNVAEYLPVNSLVKLWIEGVKGNDKERGIGKEDTCKEGGKATQPAKNHRQGGNTMKRKALLVGVNDYAPVGAGGPDLRGCVNDVRDMAHTLNVLGIVPAIPGSMRILTDASANRANILTGLQWLVTGAKKGDVLIFYYSGHGSWVADTDGDEIDKKDETICPHDFATSGMIKDDDLRKAIKGLAAGVNLDAILDSCHSGTATRELTAMAGAPEELQVTARYIEPPLDYGYFLECTPTIPVQGLFKASPKEKARGEREIVLVPGLNHVLWAGCRDNETSGEGSIGGVVRGYFTYCFCTVLRRAGVGITRARVDALVAADLAKMGVKQHPQLEGTSASLKERVFT